jgi:GT2 family glycosyltransferase
MPALARLQDRRRATTEVVAVENFGPQPEAPPVSIVVALYDRVDLLEHQLVQFADDPELCECELIYVLDSPEQYEHLCASARELAALYEHVPFRVATLSQNGGVPIARNCGAALARSARLLFLDSDVIPQRPGWVAPLSAALDRSGVGAVAPKLVYHDGGIQHAGLTFERTTDGREWDLEHRFKGLHGSLPAAADDGPMDALTGACLMVDAAAYRELDGMRPMYVQGDYEDADFCLRVRESGRECLYVPDVTLVHLEAQSYAPEARAQNRRYNRWLFSREWERLLTRG